MWNISLLFLIFQVGRLEWYGGRAHNQKFEDNWKIRHYICALHPNILLVKCNKIFCYRCTALNNGFSKNRWFFGTIYVGIYLVKFWKISWRR